MLIGVKPATKIWRIVQQVIFQLGCFNTATSMRLPQEMGTSHPTNRDGGLLNTEHLLSEMIIRGIPWGDSSERKMSIMP